MRTIDAVLFDKTGTLTKGEHVVTGIAGVERRRRRGAATRRQPSKPTASIPLARAIVAAAAATRPLVGAIDFRSITGRGVEATVDGSRYAVGGPALLRERALSEPPELADRDRTSGAARGRGPVPRATTTKSSARSRSKTRSAPKHAKPSTQLRSSGVASS